MSTGTGARAASARTAGSSPRSESTAGMDAAREIAQLLEALPELVDRAVEQRRGVGAVGHAHAGEAQVQRQRDQP